MHSRMTGALMIILGTSLGAGMLSLPISVSHQTIGMALLTLIGAWFLMTLGALVWGCINKFNDLITLKNKMNP